MTSSVRLGALAIGFSLLYIAGLLRPPERERFHHWLATVWVRADDLHLQGLRRQASIARGSVEAAATLLNRIFGEAWLSSRAISSAVFLSVASFILWLLALSALPWVRVMWNVWIGALLAVALLYFAVATNPTLRIAYMAAGWGLAFFAASWMLGPISLPRDSQRLAVMVVVLLLGVACDLAYIAFMRWMLRRASRLDGLGSIALMAASILAVAASLFLGPLLLSGGREVDGATSAPGWGPTIADLVPLTNVLDVVLALGLFGLWALVILNRLVWPVANRALYALATDNVLNRRKLLALTGAYLVALGAPSVGHLIVRLLRQLF